ncbi:hypothetical protein BJ165DRAFT_1495617 [Panaeolus papilionaceus]|nr:hypothetical protein BJ165DRAFT_1495617 [Panaeolus papilionaceus]
MSQLRSRVFIYVNLLHSAFAPIVPTRITIAPNKLEAFTETGTEMNVYIDKDNNSYISIHTQHIGRSTNLQNYNVSKITYKRRASESIQCLMLVFITPPHPRDPTHSITPTQPYSPSSNS